MKKNFLLLGILIFIFLIFKNYSLILDSTITASSIWFYKVFPYLFIMIIIQDILITLNLSTLFTPSLYIFFMSLLSGTPSSAFITGNMVKNKQISSSYGNNCLLYTYFANPLFLYTILFAIFNDYKIVVKLMLIHYLSNFLIFLFFHEKKTSIIPYDNKRKLNLSASIKTSINTNLLVLGTIAFYFIISNIFLNTFNISKELTIILRGFLEMTQGLNALITTNLPYTELLAILFISFGGLSIHTQVKCILDEYNLDYKYFLKGRILQTIIALILTIIT